MINDHVVSRGARYGYFPFHAQLERVLQSEKNESLKLDDNFQVKIKLLGISNMTHIRKNKERIQKGSILKIMEMTVVIILLVQ